MSNKELIEGLRLHSTALEHTNRKATAKIVARAADALEAQELELVELAAIRGQEAVAYTSQRELDYLRQDKHNAMAAWATPWPSESASIPLYASPPAGKDTQLLVAALKKISAYAPCSGVKDPGFTKMHMGILARDALAAYEVKT